MGLSKSRKGKAISLRCSQMGSLRGPLSWRNPAGDLSLVHPKLSASDLKSLPVPQDILQDLHQERLLGTAVLKHLSIWAVLSGCEQS